MKKYKDFKYDILDNGTVEITAYNGTATELEIPDKIGGYTVTTIGYSAFFNCGKLESITIPESVTNIGDYAFADCTNLENVSIPDSVTSIGVLAFHRCPAKI